MRNWSRDPIHSLSNTWKRSLHSLPSSLVLSLLFSFPSLILHFALLFFVLGFPFCVLFISLSLLLFLCLFPHFFLSSLIPSFFLFLLFFCFLRASFRRQIKQLHHPPLPLALLWGSFLVSAALIVHRLRNWRHWMAFPSRSIEWEKERGQRERTQR